MEVSNHVPPPLPRDIQQGLETLGDLVGRGHGWCAAPNNAQVSLLKGVIWPGVPTCPALRALHKCNFQLTLVHFAFGAPHLAVSSALGRAVGSLPRKDIKPSPGKGGHLIVLEKAVCRQLET